MHPKIKSKDEISYFSNCYIINSEILNILRAIFKDKDIIIKSRNILYKNGNIYLMYSTKIIIGELKEKIFISKYILSYNTPEILESEKKILFSSKIETYLKSFNCELNNYKIQILKKEEENKDIVFGKLLIVQDKKIDKKKPSKKKNKLKNNTKILNDNNFQKNNIKEIDLNEGFKKEEKEYLNEIKSQKDEIEKFLEEIEKIKKENKDLSLNYEESQKTINQLKSEIGNNKPFIPLIGLNNIGATCFMNATLQCMSQTKALTDYFLNNNNKDNIINNNIALQNNNELQLSPIYFELISKLWDKNGAKSFSPYNFMNTIEKMNSLFKQGQAGDSKDFIIYILEQLHKELKKPINQNINISNEPLNQYDKRNAFNHFYNDFKDECSIISDVFFGITETTNECINCKNNYNFHGLQNPICYNYQIFNCLIFPLEEVKKMKNNNLMQNNNFVQMSPNNRVTLHECFTYNQKTDYFTGQNQNYCNVCKQLSDSMYTCKIFSSPNNLVLILNRGKGNIFDVKLDFNEIIDISQFVLMKDKPQLVYYLYGVITHIGQSGPNAHFVASCKNTDNKWYRFNDAMVNPIKDFQKEVIEFGTPYILFYQKLE